MTLGPVDFMALEFPGNQFKGEILPDLLELVDREIIRIFDLVIVIKDPDGSVIVPGSCKNSIRVTWRCSIRSRLKSAS